MNGGGGEAAKTHSTNPARHSEAFRHAPQMRLTALPTSLAQMMGCCLLVQNNSGLRLDKWDPTRQYLGRDLRRVSNRSDRDLTLAPQSTTDCLVGATSSSWRTPRANWASTVASTAVQPRLPLHLTTLAGAGAERGPLCACERSCQQSLGRH